MAERDRKSIVIHGGAGAMNVADPLDRYNLDHKMTCLQGFVDTGWEALSQGTNALTVAVNTIISLENAESFNAGYGSAIGFNTDGSPLVSLDASIMMEDEAGYHFGGVTGITIMQNPILAAKELMSRQANLIHGDAANKLAYQTAMEYGVPLVDNETLMTEEKLIKFETYKKGEGIHRPKEGGTVGVVVFDGETIVAATSTGGITGKDYGRTGDSAIPGAGTYADMTAGASATGFGEMILLHRTAGRAVTLVQNGRDPQRSATSTVHELRKKFNGNGGVIIADNKGRVGVATNTSHMPNARMTWDMERPEVRER